MITYASQQGTPWSGFNGFGQAASEVQALMQDESVAIAQIDSSGAIVGYYRLDPDGTTTLYDVDGNLAGVTLAAPPGAPSPGFDWAGAFSTLGSTLSRLFGVSHPSTVPAGGVYPAAGGMGLGTLALIGGAVYLFASRRGAAGRRQATRALRRRSRRHAPPKEG